MPMLLWDASALAKRYVVENGSDTVTALFAAIPASQQISTFPIYVETFAMLMRRRNNGDISATAFAAARQLLRDEILDSPDFVLLETDTALVLAGVNFILRHHLNASDAAILATFLRYIQAQPFGRLSHVLVAADERLLRAAHTEGLHTLNPESVLASDIPTFLARIG